jgi:hypothetical protein
VGRQLSFEEGALGSLTCGVQNENLLRDRSVVIFTSASVVLTATGGADDERGR